MLLRITVLLLALVTTGLADDKPAKDEPRPDPSTFRLDPGAATADVDAAAKSIVERTNEFRKKEGLAPQKSNDQLAAAAKAFAKFMASTHKYGHEADGRTAAQRAEAHKYDYCLVLENIAMQFKSSGFQTEDLAQAFTQAWIDSPGHRVNMLNPHGVETGVGVAMSENGAYYAVQLFGRPKSMMFTVKVSNTSRSKISYTLGEQTFDITPRMTRTHGICIPMALRFELPEGSTAPKAEDTNPQKPTTYTIVNAPKGVSVRVTHPPVK